MNVLAVLLEVVYDLYSEITVCLTFMNWCIIVDIRGPNK